MPCEPQDSVTYDEMEFGVPYRIVGTRPRSAPRNRWFHANLNALFEMQETWPTRELFKQAIKRALGLVVIYEVKGREFYEYPSIAFDKMSEEDFKDLCDRFVKLVCERIIPGLPETNARQILDLLDGNSGKVGERMAGAAA